MSCSNETGNIGNYSCANFYIEDRKIIAGMLPETLIRLIKKGLNPIKTNLGYIYFKDASGQLIGTQATNTEIDKWKVTEFKPNNELSELEYAQLKELNLL